ncbi:MAG: glutamate racemase [Bacillota bacterium]|nr:glutamate racemase [Bacillota bacterium]
MDKFSKIGVFDSGLGGLSVLHTIRQIMPNESLIYIGDSGNAPYGTKEKSEVLNLSKKVCDTLVSKDVKAIVIACNTATSAAVNELRRAYDIPIIGMEPAIKPALRQTEGKVLVLATEMTLKEEKFKQLVDSLEEGYRIIKMPAPEWVQLVENHMSESDYVKKEVEGFLDKVTEKIDAVVLGCTHFIFLKPYIMAYYKDQVEIFDGNMGTALQLKNLLESHKWLNDNSEMGSVEIINTKSGVFVKKSYEMFDWLEMRDEF